ncbi:MAG: gamma carbonic anhydrase family protein [Cellulomonadaceae bacterium]|jgi:carbonic anhydrase/acetyltransferase-like protein (isoleucine patch superfamily)|nr:gamma carbonic anhydrase family protein [Cellulomonadaceae bacterium]
MPHLIPISGHTPQIHPSAWVAPNATLVGNVCVEADASVFYGAVLRGDIEAIVVGAGSNLQDNVVVHTDTGAPALIGRGVGVGHGAIIHGATIGDGALIGMGATLLSRSVIGAGAFVAAGALVLEGQNISPGHLAAGVPARDRGELDAPTRERVARNAIEYQDLKEQHRAALAPTQGEH